MKRALVLVGLVGAGAAAQEPREAVDFFRDVRPILAVHCYKCHSADAAKGGLRLDLREAAFRGGDSGEPAVVPGKGASSLLLKLVTSEDGDERMPRTAPPLSAEEVRTLRRWIDRGADWPDASRATEIHWAFRPLARPAVPAVKAGAWVRNPVDAFIAREHEARGLVPSAEASPRTLVRRLALDLTGLPPSPEEVESFLADRSPGAYERLVERLLASPHYGERWGRHWLDLARFAETNGYEYNLLRPAAWRYRDYVVRSFNEDKPFDLFLRQQLAGDEMTPLTDENLVATGFLASGRLDANQEDKALQRNDHLLDIANAAASVTLGLSMGCAQCHDHKWDPITQRDYYRFLGFFVNGQVNNLLLADPATLKAYEAAIPPELGPARDLLKVLRDRIREPLVEEKRKKLAPDLRAALEIPAEKRTPEQKTLARKAEKELAVSPEEIEKAAGADAALLKELAKSVERLEKKVPPKPHAWGFYSPLTSPHRLETLPIQGTNPLPYSPDELKRTRPRVLLRGDVHQKGEEVEIGWPAFLGPVPSGGLGPRPRSALVDWLTRPEHPLLARVWVNFVWQQHFGTALVATPADLGLRGATPSHPELLDWLAADFIAGGWSVKKLHRRIVGSATYRLSAAAAEASLRIDRENRYRWRWSPRRLEAEAVRDSILAVSGELDRTLGGPSIPDKPHHLAEVKEPRMGDPNPFRRTIYYMQRRHAFPAVQEFFDAPLAGESCPRRAVSTVSLQSLYLMNNPFIHDRAKTFAARVKDEERPLEAAFFRAFGRAPEAAELEAARALQEAAGLVGVCHALLNANEFLYVE